MAVDYSLSDVLKLSKEPKTVIIISLILIFTGLIEYFFEFPFILAIGVALFVVYIPILIKQMISEKKQKAVQHDFAKYEETMRKGREALKNSRDDIDPRIRNFWKRK